MTFSSDGALAPAFWKSIAARSSPAVLRRPLWHVMQYLSITARTSAAENCGAAAGGVAWRRAAPTMDSTPRARTPTVRFMRDTSLDRLLRPIVPESHRRLGHID